MSKTNAKPSPKLYDGVQPGRISYKPLHHKDGTIFDDVDYFELLGRKCIELDKKNRNPVVPTDYGTYDRDTVTVAKEVCKAIDNGVSREDISDYLKRCIDIDK
jgi:hypothetical protein